jgi:hypothetical protein
MLEFEAINLLFSFLNVPLLPRNHSNDFVDWVMVKYLHKQVKKKLKKVIIGSKYFALSCDEVTTIDN